ncbi:MAG TPA: DNA recombination protein RmuC [Terriglobales bacterium]|nr:DNA recombination protein RmuC [Terriglobales bacterium]
MEAWNAQLAVLGEPLSAVVPIVAIVGLASVLLLFLLRRALRMRVEGLDARLVPLAEAQERLERAVREDLGLLRDELRRSGREQRDELSQSFQRFGDTVVARIGDGTARQKEQLDVFSNQLTALTTATTERLEAMQQRSAGAARELREEVVKALAALTDSLIATMKELAAAEKVQLAGMAAAIDKLTQGTEHKLDGIRASVETRLTVMQSDSAKQLELMRQTVDEKLQGTLEKRLGESFRQVSERLELVHKGLGEMQSLATGVGDLKKVLTNVKTRGTWGEVQLGAMLEQALNPDQYAVNLAMKGGGERVEFAIRLPGQSDEGGEPVWLPIDAKFPLEDYQHLLEAQDQGDARSVEQYGKQLELRVKQCAKDICNKYLNPQHTTDFAILFLPIEGLFAEVIRRTGLTEVVQRECRVIIAGPTTLWAVLNSLQMGFRTLAIQQRSSEVWSLLGAVKFEWKKYGDVLEAVQKKLHEASSKIDQVKVRSRAVGRKLRNVQELPAVEAAALLPLDTVAEIETLPEQQVFAPFPKG